MKTINIYLETKDPDYSNALSKSLQCHSKFFSIQVGSPQHKNYEWDLYLTDDMNSLAERTVYLTDEPALATVNEENTCYILYKYQHVGHISNILRLAHSSYSKTEMLSDETVQANISSICTASGGTGCTTVALGICQELTRFHGKKVLYICMEEFESTANYFTDAYHETNNITKYVYSILNKNDYNSSTPTVYMLKDEYGVFAFYPARGRNPLRELSMDEFIKFMNHITKEELFTNLILDCGNGLDDSIVAAFQLAQYIFHVTGKSPNDNRRATYLRTIANRLASKDSSSMMHVFNFYVAADAEKREPSNEAHNEELIIEEDPASFDIINGRTVISLDKMFGQGIRDIVSHIVFSSQ